MIIHKTLPEGAFLATREIELYKLKPRKKRAYPDNIELRLNYRILLWSRYARVYYERIIDENTYDENLVYYLKHGIVYLFPDEDTLEQIREEIDKEGLTYRELMFRRENELEWWRVNKRKPTGNGDKYYEQLYKKQFQQYLDSKK